MGYENLRKNLGLFLLSMNEFQKIHNASKKPPKCKLCSNKREFIKSLVESTSYQNNNLKFRIQSHFRFPVFSPNDLIKRLAN